MCIIYTAPPGASIPEQAIRDGWMLNPHGAGIAWADGTTVHFAKGFMGLADLLAAIQAIPTGCAHLIHMRYTSSGGDDARYTHPFGLDPSDPSLLFKTSGTAPRVFAHNGTVKSKGLSSAWSDSQEIALEVSRTPLGFPVTQDFQKAMGHTRGVLLSASGKFQYKGKWMTLPGSPEVKMSNRGGWPDELDIEVATQRLVDEYRGVLPTLKPVAQAFPSPSDLVIRTGPGIHSVELLGDLMTKYPLPFLADDQGGLLYQDVGEGEPVYVGKIERYEAKYVEPVRYVAPKSKKSSAPRNLYGGPPWGMGNL